MNSLFTQLRQSIAEKDAFIGNAAHQLRNPMAALLSQAEAAEHTDDEATLRRRMAGVTEAARHRERVNQDKQQPSAQKTFDLSEMLRNLLADTAIVALKREVELSLHGAEQAINVRGNALLLREAFENILDNALKYGCPDGGSIDVDLNVDSAQGIAEASDSGNGITEGLKSTIFERFTRDDESSVGGCGLGMAIACSIVEQHGGTIELVDAADKGACFRVTLAIER